MDLETLVVSLYILVDDWLKANHTCTVRRRGHTVMLSDRRSSRSPILSIFDDSTLPYSSKVYACLLTPKCRGPL